MTEPRVRYRADRPANFGDGQNPVPSVLDRLVMDQAPRRDAAVIAAEAGSPRAAFDMAKRAMERDLEMLLSTRQCHIGWPQNLDEIVRSSHNYGIADYSGRNLGARAIQDEFRRGVEATIKIFEPRLGRVSVVMRDPAESPDRRVHFQIEATMHLNAEPITFDTVLDPVTRGVTVRIAAGG